MVASVVLMNSSWQGRHFVGTVSPDDKLMRAMIKNRTLLMLQTSLGEDYKLLSCAFCTDRPLLKEHPIISINLDPRP